MKSVTKLGRAMPAPPVPQLLPSTDPNGAADALKRKCRESLDSHAAQIAQIADKQSLILQELQHLTALAERVLRAKAARSG